MRGDVLYCCSSADDAAAVAHMKEDVRPAVRLHDACSRAWWFAHHPDESVCVSSVGVGGVAVDLGFQLLLLQQEIEADFVRELYEQRRGRVGRR